MCWADTGTIGYPKNLQLNDPPNKNHHRGGGKNMNKNKIHTILEKAAKQVFDEALVDGDYFKSLEFKVELETPDMGGFETVIIHKSKDGFFSEIEKTTYDQHFPIVKVVGITRPA